MSRFDEFHAALPRVTYHGEDSPGHREQLARMLAQTNVPVEHAASVNAYHMGSPMAHGANAVYGHLTNSVHMAGDPEGAQRLSQGVYNKLARTTVHELGHAYRRNLNPQEFENPANFKNPSWRAREEAHAENYADQHMPGSYSGYDYEVKSGTQRFDSDEYKRGRGTRFGNIDPRLS